MSTVSKNNEPLLMRYVALCNHALKHGGHQTLSHILKALCDKGDDFLIACQGTEGDEAGIVKVEIHQETQGFQIQLCACQKISSEEDDFNDLYVSSFQGLMHMVEQPEKYLKNAALLDWEWLNNRRPCSNSSLKG